MALGLHTSGEAFVVSRESIRSTRAVRGTAVQLARVFDAVCGLTVMLVIFVTLNVDQLPDELQGFLAIRLSIKNIVVAILFVAIWHLTFASEEARHMARWCRWMHDELVAAARSESRK